MDDFEIYKGRKNICGERIRMIRRHTRGSHKRMTQEDFARALRQKGCNIGRLALGRIENGEREVSDMELVYIADVLGVDINYLICGDKPISRVAEEYAKSLKSNGRKGAFDINLYNANTDDGTDGDDSDDNIIVAED